ncbi:hypothetical protein GQ457_18G007760 [Hibiscus cannabinus]
MENGQTYPDFFVYVQNTRGSTFWTECTIFFTVYRPSPLPMKFTENHKVFGRGRKTQISLPITASTQFSEPFESLLFWLYLSLLVSPFAPPSLTDGDIALVLDPSSLIPSIKSLTLSLNLRRNLRRDGQKLRKLMTPVEIIQMGWRKEDVGSNFDGWEKEWSEADVEMLKKQMVKNPVGKPGRWEAIAEAFNGKHKMESVIKKSKELGEKKTDDVDSYAKFLKNRKPLDMRMNEEGVTRNQDSSSSVGSGAVVWNSTEDIALLNALKAFPKDVAIKWETIAAAVPGKSKAACMKRVAEMKKDNFTGEIGLRGEKMRVNG